MSPEDRNKFSQILRVNGHRTTRSRMNTFQLLLGSEPQSIAQLLKKANGRIDRVSLYRHIELFEKLGIAHRIYIGWKYKIELSDSFVTHHHHLSCITCGKVIAIEDEKYIDDFITEVAKKFSFTPRRHQFEIDGYCVKCRNKK